MWSAVLLICSAAAAALSSAEWQPRWRGQIEPTPSAHQGLLAEAELPWSRVNTLRSGAEQHLPHVRTKRKLKRGKTHVISSFKHIPGKALNVATRIVQGASARDCAVHCVTSQCKAWSHSNVTKKCRFLSAEKKTIAPVPVLQPDSDYYEISLRRLGAALISFFIEGVTSHTTNINQNQIFPIEDPLDPINILTDYLEPLPSRPPVTEPPTEPSVPTDQPVTDPPTPPPPPPLPSEVPTAGPTDAPTLDPDLSYKFDFPQDCGRRPTFGLSDYERRLTPSGAAVVRTRIVGGSPVAPGSFPWQAEIQISNNRGFQHSCGGIIISNDLIMTAAHCHTEHESNYQVGVAVNNILTSDDPGQRMIAVENIYRHFAHRPDLQRGQRNDIAIMRLKFRLGEPHGLTFSDYIQPLCLPERNTTLFVGQECQISGWGLVDANSPKSAEFASTVLRGAVINILDPALCYNAYGDRFDERLMVCAGRVGGGVDTCSGDSGGPLSCRDSFGRWFVAGIVSFGWECGAVDHPGVYTRVSAYLEFVHRTAAFLTGVQVVD